MTVVALWVEPSDGNLWVAADTRFLMTQDSSFGVVRTNAASKILGLPVRCSLPAADGIGLRRPFYEATLGFAFAGDVVPAQATFAMASTLSQSLVSIDRYGRGVGLPVDISGVADLCAQLATRYTNETREASNGRFGSFDAVVFGWCPTGLSHKAYWIRPKGSPLAEYSVEQVLLGVDEDPFVLGRKDLFQEELTSLRRDGDPYHRTNRLPLIALERVIDAASAIDVGGQASIAIIPPSGNLIPLSRLRPLVPGKSAAAISFNGLDVGRPIEVGHCCVWLPGVA